MDSTLEPLEEVRVRSKMRIVIENLKGKQGKKKSRRFWYLSPNETAKF